MEAIAAAERYRAIAAGLSPSSLTELWRAALFGRPIGDDLRGALADLQALRLDVGRASAARSHPKPVAAA